MVDNDKRIPLRDVGIVGNDQQTNPVQKAPALEAALPPSPRFATKEEYIKHLIDHRKIKRDHRSCKDGKIHLKGCLRIDDSVAKHLDWSDVYVDSAIAENGTISKYKYLPHTRTGVKTELTTTDIDEYMSHQAFEADRQDERYVVKGIFRIPNQETLPDFSRIIADQVYCYKDGKIKPEKLPTALEGFFGINPEKLDCATPESSRVARSKGLKRRQIRHDKPGFLKQLFSGLDLFKHSNNGN